MRSITESILLDIMFDLPGSRRSRRWQSRGKLEGTTPPLYIYYADHPDRTGDAGASA
jgi:hypothetical protein